MVYDNEFYISLFHLGKIQGHTAELKDRKEFIESHFGLLERVLSASGASVWFRVFFRDESKYTVGCTINDTPRKIIQLHFVDLGMHSGLRILAFVFWHTCRAGFPKLLLLVFTSTAQGCIATSLFWSTQEGRTTLLLGNWGTRICSFTRLQNK